MRRRRVTDRATGDGPRRVADRISRRSTGSPDGTRRPDGRAEPTHRTRPASSRPRAARSTDGGLEVVVDGWRFEVDVEDAERAALRDARDHGGAAKGHATGRPRSVPSSRDGSCPWRSSPGDAVVAGQQLLAVEAMKMENELRAPRDGIVDGWPSAAGQTVELGDLAGRDSGDATPSRPDRRGRPTPPATAGARPLRAKALRAAPERRDPFETSSGIRDPRPLHARRRGRPRRGPRPRPARRVPVHPGRPADDVPEPLLDDAPVRRLRDRRGDEPPLPLPPRAGPDRAVGRLRPADPDGLRLGRPRGGGGGRPGRRADLQPGRHGASCSTACRSARSARR